MPSVQQRPTAKIYAFRPRADAARRIAERVSETQTPIVRCGGWYHDDAIREERIRKP